jgi:predicted amidophosphoribosyltransferase
MKYLDIISIHNNIVKSLKDKQNESQQTKLQILEKLKSYTEQQYRLRNLLEHEIRVMYNNNTDQDLYYYLLMATPVIDRYKQELSKPIVVSFMTSDATSYQYDSIKHKIYTEYLNIAFRYMSVSHIEELPKPTGAKTCVECNLELVTCHDTALCSECGQENNEQQFVFSYTDSQRINVINKYTYIKRTHFKDCINQFQGKQNSTIKPEVFENLLKQFEKYDLLLPGTTLHQQCANITKNKIYMFLKELDYGKHYEDINLIHHIFTNHKLNDISYLETALMNDFDKLVELYDQVYIKTKKIKRKNFINTHYILFQLLNRHKYPCTPGDFNLLKTLERKKFYDTICSELFEILGWNFTNIF